MVNAEIDSGRVEDDIQCSDKVVKEPSDHWVKVERSYDVEEGTAKSSLCILYECDGEAKRKPWEVKRGRERGMSNGQGLECVDER